MIGEEAGGQVGGYLGTAGGVALCVGFGIATGGLALLGCAIVGGGVLGISGSYVGGEIGEAFNEPRAVPVTDPEEIRRALEQINRGNEVCPNCHDENTPPMNIQWEFEGGTDSMLLQYLQDMPETAQ